MAPLESNAVLNSSVLERIRKAGGEALLDRLVDCFLSYGPERFEKLTAAIQGGDWAGVEFHAHALKSSAGNVGARSLFALLGEIETAAGQGKTAVVAAALDALQNRYEEFLGALSRVRQHA
jgi:HPt (histidine-containing phosphotransfer) domain-containing protein